jgi:hypothetical protein
VGFLFWLLDFFVSGRGTCLSVRHAAEKGVFGKKNWASTCLMNSFDIPYGLRTGCVRNPLPLLAYPGQELRMGCASLCGAFRIDFLKKIFELDSDFILTYIF